MITVLFHLFKIIDRSFSLSSNLRNIIIVVWEEGINERLGNFLVQKSSLLVIHVFRSWKFYIDGKLSKHSIWIPSNEKRGESATLSNYQYSYEWELKKKNLLVLNVLNDVAVTRCKSFNRNDFFSCRFFFCSGKNVLKK